MENESYLLTTQGKHHLLLSVVHQKISFHWDLPVPNLHELIEANNNNKDSKNSNQQEHVKSPLLERIQCHQ